MKNLPLILGILAGIAGLCGSAFGYFVGSLSSAFGGGSGIAAASMIAVALSIAGIVGAVMTHGKPRSGAYLMMIAGIDGIIAVSFGYIIAGPLFIIAASLALKNAKEEKVAVNKTQRWVYIGIAVAIFALLLSTNDTSTSGSGSTSDNGTSTSATVADAQQEKLCPDIAKMSSSFSFTWGEGYSGNRNLYLYAPFLKSTEFSDGWELDNPPDTGTYSTDSFFCELGSRAGQSTNKLYCDVSYMYEPRLIKNTIDENGNITSSDYRYITQFIFDANGKDVNNAVDLASLTLESYDCSKTSP